MEDAEGRLMREDRLIRLSGKRPVTNNLIRQLVKNIVGRYRTRSAEPAGHAIIDGEPPSVRPGSSTATGLAGVAAA